MTFHSRRVRPAQGSKAGGCQAPRIAVSFDDETFRQLTAEAVRLKVPVAQVVRDKVAKGIEGAR